MNATGKTKTCLYCDERFQASNLRRVFCSDRCKTRYSRENRSCFYCGEISNSRDHVIPHSTTTHESGKRRWYADWVNCCRECNILLGNYIGGSFYERIMHLHDRFKVKKKLHKGFVEWDDDELDEVSKEMRTWIWNKQQERMRDERRLSHIRLVALKVSRFEEDSDDDVEQ